MVAPARSSTAVTRLRGAMWPAGSVGPDELTSVWDRTAWMLGTPILLMSGAFVLTFGLGMALIADEWEGWLVAGALVGLAVLAVVGDSFKVWVALYPLAFLSPRFRLGEYEDSGEKMLALQPWDVLALLVVALGLWRVWRTGRLGLPRALTVGLILMLLFTLKGIRSGPDIIMSIKISVRTLLEPMLVFAVIAGARWTRVELQRVVRVLLLVGAVTGTAAILEYIGGSGEGRLASSWEGSNIQAAFLGAIIPVTIGVTFGSASRAAAVAGAGTLALTSLTVALTMTRGVWLAVGGALGLLVIWLRAWLWAGLVAILVLSAVLAAPPQFLDRLESIASFDEERSAANRLKLWERVSQLIADRPLGYGIDAFRLFFHLGAEFNSLHAHNVLLDMGFALGIPAVLTFLGTLGYVLLRAARTLYPWRGSEEDYLLLGLGTGSLCLITAGLVDGSITMWPILAQTFWFLLALTCAATTLIREGEPGSRQTAAGLLVAD